MPKSRKRKSGKMYARQLTRRKYKERDFFSKRYKGWRAQVYERDRNKCQMPGCSYEGKRIQAHHITKWADSVKLRFSVYNGITLCFECHKKIDGKENAYKYIFRKIVKKNTEQQKLEAQNGEPVLDSPNSTELEH